MSTSTVESALRRLGEVVEYHEAIEILLVGGAAGMVTGVLARDRVTVDCDVMVYLPPDAMGVVENAARSVASEMGLSQRWFNSDVQLRLDALPDGWASRKIPVEVFGRLRVFAASRVDLIAMKVLALLDGSIWRLSTIILAATSLSNLGMSREHAFDSTPRRDEKPRTQTPKRSVNQSQAGRDQDIEDLQAMRVRRDDVAFVEGYLESLAGKGTGAEQVAAARELLGSIPVHEHE